MEPKNFVLTLFGLLRTSCTLAWPGSHFVHTFQGSVLESVSTSFALCAHCLSAYRVPGPARRSIRPTSWDKIVWIVFIYSGIRASGEAHGVWRQHARRPGQNDAAKYIRGQLPRGGDQAPVQARSDQVSKLISAYRTESERRAPGTRAVLGACALPPRAAFLPSPAELVANIGASLSQ